MAPVIPGPTRSDAPTENVSIARDNDPNLEVIPCGPLKLVVIEDGRNTDNRIGIVKVIVPPGMPGPPQHWHQMHDETFIVTKGTATFSARDKTIEASAGDTVIVPPCSPHTFGNNTDAEVEMLCTMTPAYYVNYFRLMAEMAEQKPGKKVDGPITQRAMLQYATIQTGKDHDWSDPNANPGKNIKNFS